MYNDESYDNLRSKELLRRKFKRRLRIKRFIAAFILLLIFALIVGGICFLAVTLIKNYRKSSNDASTYKYENDRTQLVIVDNVFSESERRELFPYEFTDSETNEAETVTLPEEDSDNTDITQYTGSGLIIIDAGHGGKDGGTTNNLCDEKDINLEIAYWLKEELELRGYSIFMTRTDDTYIDVNKRASIANSQNNPLAMVSIHQNACEESDEVHGVEAWTYERKGCIELAKLLSEKVSEAVGAVNRGANYRTNLVVTSKTTMPSVIIECGYMSNPEEAQKLTEEDYQVKLARGIANALDDFINSYY